MIRALILLFLHMTKAERRKPYLYGDSEKTVNKPFNRDVTDSTQFYNPQLPVLTEKPVYGSNIPTISNIHKDVGKWHKDKSIKSVLTKKPVIGTIKHKDRRKLVTLLLSPKSKIQMRDIQYIDDKFKSGPLFRTGFLSSLIKDMNNRIKYLNKTVQKLRILEEHNQMKEETEKIQNLLVEVQSFLKTKAKSGTQSLKGRFYSFMPKPISWAYYDDSKE